MNPTIVKIIDLMFRGIPETEETAAIREELLTNSQARYDDLIAAGESPNTALGQVLDSLRGMEEVLDEYRNSQQASPQPDDPFADLRRKAAAMGSQWEQTTGEIESKLETMADQLEDKWDSFADKAENAAKNAWDTAVKGFRSAMDTMRSSVDFNRPETEPVRPANAVEDGDTLTYHFSAEEARRIDVQLLGEDVEVTASRDDQVHLCIRKDDERLFHLEANGGTLTMRRNPRAACSDDEENAESNGLGSLFSVISNAIGNVFTNAHICGDTVYLALPHHLEQVHLQTTGGDLELLDLHQKTLVLSTAGGDIDLTGCTADTASLTTTSGDVEATGCTFGDAQLNATSGDLELNIQADKVTANTTSGDIDLSGELNWLKLNTTSGDVEVEVEGTGFEGALVNTVSGDVSFTLPRDVIPCMETATVSGSVSFTDHDRTSPIPLRINTVSGDISVENF